MRWSKASRRRRCFRFARDRCRSLHCAREAQRLKFPDAESLKLKLAVEGGNTSAVSDLPFVTVVTEKSQADLIWSADGKVEHVVGGVVAENVDVRSIKGVVSKWAALKWLNH